MYKFSFRLLFLTGLSIMLALSFRGQAQSVDVQGTAVDAETGTPLAGANVFLSGTTLGTAADSAGSFSIQDVPPGAYDLVASMLGYERVRRTLQVGREVVEVAPLRLKATTYALGDVMVEGEQPRDWRRNLKRFESLLFGFTPNADDCEVLNPEVLSFTVDQPSGQLTATASAPVEVINHALGYQITFHLDHFSGSTRALDWGGSTFFTELEPKGRRQTRRWRANRERAYRGSFRHFLAGVASGHLREDGFRIHLVETPGQVGGGPSEDERLMLYLTPGPESHLSTLSFSGTLHITYLHESDRGLSGTANRDHQTSWLVLSGAPISFDDTGRLEGFAAFQRHGYWARERIADTLPWDYVP